jgi:hypothetical protein
VISGGELSEVGNEARREEVDKHELKQKLPLIEAAVLDF